MNWQIRKKTIIMACPFLICGVTITSDLGKIKAIFLTLAKKDCLVLFFNTNRVQFQLCWKMVWREYKEWNWKNNTHYSLTKLIAAQQENIRLEYPADRLERYQICEHNYSRVKMSEPIVLK